MKRRGGGVEIVEKSGGKQFEADEKGPGKQSRALPQNSRRQTTHLVAGNFQTNQWGSTPSHL